MKKKKFIFYALCLIFCFITTGCAQVYELSEEDEDMIAVYCAKTVNKFNSIKPQGYVNLSKSEIEDALGTEENTEDVSAEETPIAEDAAEDVTSPDTTVDEANVSDSETVADTTQEDVTSSASLNDLIGIAGLDFKYKSAVEMSYYTGGYYDISPSTGNDFLVITYEVSNTTDSDIVLDIPSMGVKFRASVGGISNTADNTILSNEDLSVFSGTIEAGTTEELILLFQFKPENLTDLSSLKLPMVQGDTTTNIEY